MHVPPHLDTSFIFNFVYSILKIFILVFNKVPKKKK